MAKIPAAQADVTLNVHVIVGTPDANNRIRIRDERRFKNTATRLMTESICNYLTGAESSYKRGKGRPNYMGFGTMGISEQKSVAGKGIIPADTVSNFSDKTYVEGETTRPWFESTSLALTTVCGAINQMGDGTNPHFWDPKLGWYKNGFTGERSDKPEFQGELCTAIIPDGNWDVVERIPILRADVLSDCPSDWDFGVEGYSSRAIFYGYASVEWVHNLLNPMKIDPDDKDGKKLVVDKEHSLDAVAISEFGLYEKNNTDPHGLETMLAGFRVPTPEDIVYVTDGEVILVEWKVTVRALMPFEDVTPIEGGPAPTGISITSEVRNNHSIKFTAEVQGLPGVGQEVHWGIEGNASVDTTIDSNGLLTIAGHETASVIYVNVVSTINPDIGARAAVIV